MENDKKAINFLKIQMSDRDGWNSPSKWLELIGMGLHVGKGCIEIAVLTIEKFSLDNILCELNNSIHR